MNKGAGKTILFLSIPLAILVAGASCGGIYINGLYKSETASWEVQCMGQDLIDLWLVVPALIVTAVLSYRGSSIATFTWAGVVMYILYTFIIYAFDVHFNRLFLVYCMSLGLSFYSLAWYAYSTLKGALVIGTQNKMVSKVTGTFFIVISIAFYLLWLSEIIPATINDSTPMTLVENGLVTNGVHVLDLSVFLPLVLISGVAVIRQKQYGLYLAVAVLSFFILMNITIGILAIMMEEKGIQTGSPVPVIMGLLTLISSFLWLLNIKSINRNTAWTV